MPRRCRRRLAITTDMYITISRTTRTGSTSTIETLTTSMGILSTTQVKKRKRNSHLSQTFTEKNLGREGEIPFQGQQLPTSFNLSSKILPILQAWSSLTSQTPSKGPLKG